MAEKVKRNEYKEKELRELTKKLSQVERLTLESFYKLIGA